MWPSGTTVFKDIFFEYIQTELHYIVLADTYYVKNVFFVNILNNSTDRFLSML